MLSYLHNTSTWKITEKETEKKNNRQWFQKVLNNTSETAEVYKVLQQDQ